MESPDDSITAVAAKEGPSISVFGDTYRILSGASKPRVLMLLLIC